MHLILRHIAPSTLKDQMLLMLPHSTASDPLKSSQVMNELQQSFYNHNQFVTKTCLTTYTYSTTYVVDGTTKIESREKVITNTATEERNAYNIRPTVTSGITLTQVFFICISYSFTEFKIFKKAIATRYNGVQLIK